MTGLTVRLSFTGQPITGPQAWQSLQRLAHRPADREGVYCDGPVLLGARERWSVPGAENAAQPRSSLCGRYTAVMDGYLDYIEDLAARLGEPATTPDIDLVLTAFRRWGHDGFARIEGNYVVAIWDRVEQLLTVVRDGFAAPPLYWWTDSTAFVAGSEIAQVIGDLGRKPPVNEGFAAEVLTGRIVHPTETLWAGIERLSDGAVLQVRETGVRRGPAFRGPMSVKPTRCAHDSEYAELVLDVVGAAVKSACRARGPVGAHVSGGLDSSMIAALACKHAESPVRAITYAYQAGSPADERPYWELVHAHLGIEAIIDDGDAVDPEWIRLQIARSLDLPVSPDSVSAWRTGKCFAAQGGRVLLSGQGGDELWAGTAAHVLTDLRAGRPVAAYRALSAHADDLAVSRRRAFKRAVLVPLAFQLDPVRTARRVQRSRGENYIHPAFRRRVELLERVSATGERPPLSIAQHEIWRRARDPHIRLHHGLAARELASIGLERRYPFADRRVVGLAVSLPEHQRGPGYARRLVQRAAASKLLPAIVASRQTKAYFDQTYAAAVRALEVGTDHLERRGWVRPGLGERLRRSLAADGADDALADVGRAWSVAILELWAEHAS